MASNISEFERITKLLENKNVCLVGNSIELLNHNKGAFIDSHDVVIRMGRGTPTPNTTIRLVISLVSGQLDFYEMSTIKSFQQNGKTCPSY